MNIGAIGRAAPAINRALTDVVEAPRNIERWQFEKEQMGNERAISGMRLNKMKFEEGERKKREEFLDSRTNITLEPSLAYLPKETSEAFINMLKKSGMVDENGFWTQRTRAQAYQTMLTDEKLFNMFSGGIIKTHHKKYQEAQEELFKLQDKVDVEPKKLEDARKKLEMMEKNYNMALMGDEKGREFIQKMEEMKQKRKPQKWEPGTREEALEFERAKREKPEKEYQPQVFIDKEGKQRWLEPGKEIPMGWKKYEKPEKEKGEGELKSTKLKQLNDLMDKRFSQFAPPSTKSPDIYANLPEHYRPVYDWVQQRAEQLLHSNDPVSAINQASREYNAGVKSGKISPSMPKTEGQGGGDIGKLFEQATEAIKLQPNRKKEIMKKFKDMSGKDYSTAAEMRKKQGPGFYQADIGVE